MARGDKIDELAREIGERLVPEIGEDQIIPAEAVFGALRDEPGEGRR